MKLKALIRHLEKHECILLREGANHSVYINSIQPELKAPVPKQ